MARPVPEQHPPPVQKLRIRYAKRGRARFTSHRDFGRAFERALRRADIPMAYSSGFSPHPRISYANASPTGAATESEYLEIGVVIHCDPDLVRSALDTALPPGLDIITVVEAGPGALADRLTGSIWRIELPGVPEPVLQGAVSRFLAESEVAVERMTKNGVRGFDARSAVIDLTVGPERLLLVLEHRTPLVRPDDVLTALRGVHPDLAPPVPPVTTRLSQGTLVGHDVLDPLADEPGRSGGVRPL